MIVGDLVKVARGQKEFPGLDDGLGIVVGIDKDFYVRDSPEGLVPHQDRILVHWIDSKINTYEPANYLEVVSARDEM